MAVTLFTINDLLTTTDNLQTTRIGTPATSIVVKPGGGIRITQDSAIQWDTNQLAAAGVIMAFEGATTVDLTQNLFMVSFSHNASNRIQVPPNGVNGIIIRLYSGTTFTTNYAEWHMGGNDTFVGSFVGHLPYVIDAESTPQRTVGTFSASSVRYWGIAQGWFAQVPISASRVFISRQVLLSKESGSGNRTRIHGANSNWRELHNAITGTDYTNIYYNNSTLVGTTLILNIPIIIGQSGTTTSFDDQGLTIITQTSNDSEDPRFHYTNDSIPIYLDLQNGDSVTLSGTYRWSISTPFDFNVNNSSTINVSGATFVGMGQFDIGPDVTGGARYELSGNNKVIDHGATITGTTVVGTLELRTVKNLSNVNATKLDLTQPGTYSFTNCTFGEIENTSAGAITVSGAGSAVLTGNISTNAVTITVQNLPTTSGADPCIFFEELDGSDQSFSPRRLTEVTITDGSSSYTLTTTAGTRFEYVIDALGYHRGEYTKIVATADMTVDGSLERILDGSGNPRYGNGTTAIINLLSYNYSLNEVQVTYNSTNDTIDYDSFFDFMEMTTRDFQALRVKLEEPEFLATEITLTTNTVIRLADVATNTGTPTLDFFIHKIGSENSFDIRRSPFYTGYGLNMIDQQTVVTVDIPTTQEISDRIERANGPLDTTRKVLVNRTDTNSTTGVMTVYDDDDSTSLLTANLYEDIAGTQAYRGQGAERRDRLTT